MGMSDMAKKIDPQQEEVDSNYKVFLEKLPELIVSHPGQYALMRHGEIIEFMESSGDAFKLGHRIFPDGRFSIQQVTLNTINLGWFSYVQPYH